MEPEKIVQQFNNVEWDSNGDPLYSYDQMLSAVKQALQQCTVSGWRAFEAGQMPEPMQEVWIVWPSGDFPPEIRKIPEADLKMDWSGMRWMPVPAYR